MDKSDEDQYQARLKQFEDQIMQNETRYSKLVMKNEANQESIRILQGEVAALKKINAELTSRLSENNRFEYIFAAAKDNMKNVDDRKGFIDDDNKVANLKKKDSIKPLTIDLEKSESEVLYFKFHVPFTQFNFTFTFCCKGWSSDSR